ncbi:hypothetical protein RHS01_11298 [Rhizoctonia solani]|uniref:Protein kinase domain-containing protein n=1 Tax=Rhizoctonia solani TaxID=456999 RepID=A0A8H7M1M1_9AGAM|nr:hypothetical protein RHS01_11298 [Rhizoctonia solani]
MSQSRTPSRSRISGQLSGSGTIASETPLLRDEFYGRRTQISFTDFGKAFLQIDDSDPLDEAAKNLHEATNIRQLLTICIETIRSSTTKRAAIYAALTDLMNAIVDSTQAGFITADAHPLRFSCLTSTRSVSGQKANISVVCEYKIASPHACSTQTTPINSRSGTQPLPRFSASQSFTDPGLSLAELPDKHPIKIEMNESDIQLGRYMLEMRSAQPSRAAGYGLQFMKDQVSIWYSDADSTITSAPIPLDSPSFVWTIMHLACASAEEIGYLPYFLDDANRATTEIVGLRLVILDVIYHITEVISLARAVHGRCTCVLGVLDPSGVELAIKLSWQVATRVSEVNMLQVAHSRNVQGLVDIIASTDLRKLSQGRRSRLPPAIQRALQIEDRVLRVIVLPLCIPLYKVPNLSDFMKACISLLDTIHQLYTRARILHRDVSVNNLMVNKVKPSEGVLIDLDLGHEIPDDGKQCGPTSSHRTGTLPFMALDLLHDESEYPHYHRHDLESFVYVFLWIVGKYDDGDDKLSFLEFDPKYSVFSPTLFYDQAPMRELIIQLMDVIRDAHAKHRQYLGRKRLSTVPTTRDSSAGNGYANAPTGRKRQRLVKPPVDVYPEELPNLTYSTIRNLIENALDSIE